VNDAASPRRPEAIKHHSIWFRLARTVLWAWGCLIVLFILLVLVQIVAGPPTSGKKSLQSAQAQISRTIGLSMFQYANDHNGKYPEGNSSTEIFQKLLDDGYINYPEIFYTPLTGKIKPVAGQKLKPENVCWDVTCCVDSTTPDSLPLVFMTGYKVTYAPGAAAVPIIKPFPPYTDTEASWWKRGPFYPPGIAVLYKSNASHFLLLVNPGAPDASIPNFVPPDFDAKGKTYRQLTPDGQMP
jgi:hypothetical protein